MATEELALLAVPYVDAAAQTTFATLERAPGPEEFAHPAALDDGDTVTRELAPPAALDDGDTVTTEELAPPAALGDGDTVTTEELATFVLHDDGFVVVALILHTPFATFDGALVPEELAPLAALVDGGTKEPAVFLLQGGNIAAEAPV